MVSLIRARLDTGSNMGSDHTTSLEVRYQDGSVGFLWWAGRTEGGRRRGRAGITQFEAVEAFDAFRRQPDEVPPCPPPSSARSYPIFGYIVETYRVSDRWWATSRQVGGHQASRSGATEAEAIVNVLNAHQVALESWLLYAWPSDPRPKAPKLITARRPKLV